MKNVEEEIRALIQQNGPITFSQFMQICLYSPKGGFYSARANRINTEFGTSPTSHPLFGTLIAKQLKQMGKMGGVSGILSMLPGVSKAQKLMAENKISDKLINHQIAIINSMTKQERSDPNLIKASRKIRISKGSGTRVQDVNKLLKQFLQSQKMMKRMKSMGKSGMPNDLMQKLQGNFPPKLN